MSDREGASKVSDGFEPEAQQQGVQSVEVGARVLGALELAHGPAALSDLARLSGLHPSKVHRYLVSLVRTGLAAQDAQTGRYDFGPAARRIGVEALRRTDAESLAAAHAVRLRDRTGHTVNIAVWSEAGPVIVRWDSGAHALPITIRVGSVLPLLDSAHGLVFLAHLPQRETAPALERQQHQHETRRLRAEEQALILDDVRQAGHALAPSGLIHGFAADAAPVFDAEGRLVMAMGLVVPTRLLLADDGQLRHVLQDTAQAVSAELGHPGAAAPTRPTVASEARP